MIVDGAGLLDVGVSRRPGSISSPPTDATRYCPTDASEEHPDVPVSVDTRKSHVAHAALEAGAAIVNDISAGDDPSMFAAVAETGAGIVLMHLKGEPKTMQDDPTYYDVVAEVRGFLGDRIGAALSAGIDLEQLCVDPGIGFGKTLEHNLVILHDIRAFHHLRVPLLVGQPQRFIGTLTATGR
jgi:dihydropteroate synthase